MFMSVFSPPPTPYRQGKLSGIRNASKILANRLALLHTSFIDTNLKTPLHGYALPTGCSLSTSTGKMTPDRVQEWMDGQYPLGRGYYYGGFVRDGSATIDVFEFFDTLEDALYMALVTGANYVINIHENTKMEI
jgi:hypothetical protein